MRIIRVTTVSAMIAPPQLRPALSWKNLRSELARSTSGWRMLASGITGGPHAVVLAGVDRADVEREAVRDGVEAAVAEGIAAQEAPGGEQEAADGAEALDRLDGVGGAGRLVAAAARAGRGNPALVGADWGEEERVSRGTPPARGTRQRLFDALGDARLAPSRSIRSPISGRATRTKSCPGGRRSERPQKASRSTRLTRLRSTAPPILRLAETPSLTRAPPPRRRGESCRGRGSGSHEMSRRGRRGRTHRCARGGGVVAPPSTAVRRFRPLRRRRLRIARPPRVLIRARNPWVLARFRFFG